MTKLIQYLHGPNWVPACVTALSVRQYGKLDAEHILYSTDPKVLENPYIRYFFDQVREPSWDWRKLWESDLVMERNHPSHDGRKKAWPADFRKFALTKYGCFLHEPCDSGPVLFLDNDIFCLTDARGVLPFQPLTWSARAWVSGDIPRLNGGVLAKSVNFDPAIFLYPLENEAARREAFALHRLDDEALASWSMIHGGLRGLKNLSLRYNKNVASAIPPDSVFLHFNAPEKPWLGRFLKVSCEYYDRWTATARAMMDICGYPEDGAAVPAEWRWPHRLGEWKHHQVCSMRF